MAKKPLPKPNENCLAGIWCPNCGSWGSFRIHGTAWFKCFDDDGCSDVEEMDWENDSQCICVVCKHSGTIDDFRTPEAGAEGVQIWGPEDIWIWKYLNMEEARGVSAKLAYELCPSCTKKSLVRWRGADGEDYESCLNGRCPQLSRHMGPIG